MDRDRVETRRLAADVGGTFTDVAYFDPRTGDTRYGKTLTTPEHLVHGVQEAVDKAGARFSDADLFLHGSTIAINTLLERTGARTALLTTRGFRDIYEIGRVNRHDAYNLFFKKHEPLVERALRIEISERMNAAGEVVAPLDEVQVEVVARALADMGIESIAILFLHSYANASHERRARDLIRARHPEIFVTSSHELSQEYREFERTSTVTANAYLGPRVASYLREIESHIATARFGGDFLVVQSSGGLYEVGQAQRECIRMLESGPAGGINGAKVLCTQLGVDDAIGFDMGGTTAKAGVIAGGEVLMTGSTIVGGYAQGLPVQIPMIDIQEVGTGGGSIARVETGGALRVGPQSAGASPGPACYGLGGEEPTVTDANLLLGRLSPERFLGGEMQLDMNRATDAMRTRVAAPLGLGLIDAAEGILRIAATSMAHVVRRVTTDRGLDASDFTLIAYGGVGPLHAAMVAKELRIARVIVPQSPGHFSAFGMLAADYRRDYVNTWFTPLTALSFDALEARYEAMEATGRESIGGTIPASANHGAEAVEAANIEVARAADMRYVGQEHAVTVDLAAELFRQRDLAKIKAAFDAVHDVRYGYADVDQPCEIVSLRTSVIGIMDKPPLEVAMAGCGTVDPQAHRGERPVYFREAGDFLATPTFARNALRARDVIDGPALVEEYASTTVVHPGDTLTVDSYGNLRIEIPRT